MQTSSLLRKNIPKVTIPPPKTLLTTNQVEIIDNKEIAKIVLNKHIKTFIVHMTFLSIMVIQSDRKALMAILIAKEV